MSSKEELHQKIEDDFQNKHPTFHKARRKGIATLVGVMLEVRNSNMMELAEALPRTIGTPEHRYQYVERQLKNEKIHANKIIQPYALEVINRLMTTDNTIVLQLDQSHINKHHEVLMLSVRVCNRALPVAWIVKETQGNIGFESQKELLESVQSWMPQEAKIILAADRFYGTAQLIKWCQTANWGYRIRLKSNLTLAHEGGELTTGDILTQCPQGVVQAELYGSGVYTNIGVLHEAGHKEQWIIAMDATPSRYKVLDYGLRWGIEAMFSDFKSRGFHIANSQIKKPDRLERLIMIMSIALYWAVSTGMFAQSQESEIKKGV